MPWIQRLGGTTKAATSRPGHYVCETTQTMGFERRKTILFTYICYQSPLLLGKYSQQMESWLLLKSYLYVLVLLRIFLKFIFCFYKKCSTVTKISSSMPCSRSLKGPSILRFLVSFGIFYRRESGDKIAQMIKLLSVNLFSSMLSILLMNGRIYLIFHE